MFSMIKVRWLQGAGTGSTSSTPISGSVLSRLSRTGPTFFASFATMESRRHYHPNPKLRTLIENRRYHHRSPNLRTLKVRRLFSPSIKPQTLKVRREFRSSGLN
jgi:hypothetical protein